MAINLYQVSFDENGQISGVQQLPPEVPRKRVIFIREETEHDARKKAKVLYSLAK